MDNTRINGSLMDIVTEKEYLAIMENSSLKTGVEKKLEDVKRKMLNPKFTDLEELQNNIDKTRELPRSADKDKLLKEFFKIKAEIQKRMTKTSSLKLFPFFDEDSLNETSSDEDMEFFFLKTPIKEIKNDLMKISDIKKSAANHSATINNNIIVNLKSINSTFIDSNLLENNLKFLLDDSIDGNETISRIDETRKHLEQLKPEVDDDQQWILEQFEGYLLNVELDSLTSKLISDIKTFLSNFNG